MLFSIQNISNFINKIFTSSNCNSISITTNNTQLINSIGMSVWRFLANILYSYSYSNSNSYSMIPPSDEIELIDSLSNVNPNKINKHIHNQTHLKQIPIEKLVWKIISKNLSMGFIINMGLNILLCSIMIPGLFKLSNDYLILGSSMFSKGISVIILGIGCEIISTAHKNFIIEPSKRKFISLVHSDLEEEVNSQILKINWNKLRELNKNELDRKKDGAKWNILGLVNMGINTFINLFSFFGYIGWIGYISPLSIIIYVIVLGLLTIYYPHKKEKNSDENRELWDKYYNKQTGLYTDIIHLKGSQSLDQMKECIYAIETKRDKDKESDSLFTDTIKVVFNICFIVNCLCLYWFENPSILSNPSNILIYIQYSCMGRNSVTMCISIYTQYSDAKREYAKLEEIVGKTFKRVELIQEVEFETITIESLEYIYPQDSNTSNKPFHLVLDVNTVLSFKQGQIIMLEGNSGHGKSTFSDIINGIIPFSEYKSSIYLDKTKKVQGFDVLTQSRYYNEQTEAICWKPSVYEIVTGKTIHIDKEFNPCGINKSDEDIVWDALTICSCLDFIKKDNTINDLKWIYTRNIGMSGGQKGRIALARSIYRVMTICPKIVTLDEVDKAIQSELVVDIMLNIYKYARNTNTLMFVICHNSDVKKLDEYDQIINFTKGLISLV
jgi:ABC-type multidrug transport system fused ATPase/permease subunit